MKLKEIIRNIQTPFYVYDEAKLRTRINEVKKSVEGTEGITFFFNAKSNPNPNILKIFEEEGCGVLCSSMADLLLAIKSSLKDEMIFLDASNVSEKELMVASMRNARMFASDDEVLVKIKAAAFQIPDGICFGEKDIEKNYLLCREEGVLKTGLLLFPEQKEVKVFADQIKETVEKYRVQNKLDELEFCIAADEIFLKEAGIYVKEGYEIENDCGVNRRAQESNYNGKLREAEYLFTKEADIKQIRRAETYDDLFATIDFSSLPYCD